MTPDVRRAALCLLLLVGCRHPSAVVDRGEAPVYRLVDATWRDDATLRPPPLAVTLARRRKRSHEPSVATVGDARRYVLFAPPDAGAWWRRDVVVSQAGTIDVEVPLRGPLGRAHRVAVAPRYAIGTTWHRLPVTSEPVVTLPSGRRGLRLALRDTALTPGRRVDVYAQIFWYPAAGTTEYRTPPLAMPEGGNLDLATGLVAGTAGTQVRFRVRFCEGDACVDLSERDLASTAAGKNAWHPQRVSLAAVAGRTGRLVFDTQLHGPAPDAAAVPVWGNPVVVAPAAAPAGPSAILISVDTLRADHLSPYGYTRATSPALARFAKQGTLFEHCVSVATRTEASHMSMFTSLLPSEHGTRMGLDPLKAPVPLLAELLRAHGLATAAITEDGALAARIGFGRGFELYVETKSPVVMRPKGYVELTLARGRAWLERHRRQRFFLFLRTYQVHAPYDPPEAYRSLFADEPPPSVPGRPPGVRPKIDAYDQEIRYTDDTLGRFFEWLAQEGLDRTTIVVVTSDHGEEFLEHGVLGHENLPYRELLHVPLIWRGPGIAAGRRIAWRVSHLDLAPTLLDLLGAKRPPHLRGRSYARAFGPDGVDAGDPARVFVSEAWSPRLPDDVVPPAEAVQQGTDKLLRFRREGREEVRLYDLSTDPHERRDRARTDPARAQALEQALDHVIAERPKSTAPARYVPPVDPERTERLRELGYVK